MKRQPSKHQMERMEENRGNFKKESKTISNTGIKLIVKSRKCFFSACNKKSNRLDGRWEIRHIPEMLHMYSGSKNRVHYTQFSTILQISREILIAQ